MKNFVYFIIIMILFSCSKQKAIDLYNKGCAIDSLGDHDKASQYYQMAIKKDSLLKWAYINIAVNYSIKGLYDSAIYTYNRLLKFDKKNITAIFNTGLNYRNLKDLKTAISYYNLALDTKGSIDYVKNDRFPNEKAEFDVPRIEIVYDRGIAYYYLDSLKLSYKDFKDCISSNYRPVDSHFFLALILIRYNKKEKACEHLNYASYYGDKEASELKEKYCK